MGKIREYTNGEVTIVWEASKCIHSAKCVAGSPHVFKPKERPWVQLEDSETEPLIKTIKTCPSGALSYYMISEGNNEEVSDISETTKVDVMPNGPLLIHGNISLKHADGSEENKTNRTAFCRCGKSNNQPFCDGTHNKA